MLTTITIFTLRPGQRRWGLAQMGTSPGTLKRVPGLRFDDGDGLLAQRAALQCRRDLLALLIRQPFDGIEQLLKRTRTHTASGLADRTGQTGAVPKSSISPT